MRRRAIRSDRREYIVSATRPDLQARATSRAAGIPGVKHVIAVASGKGGVGKSTTSCNLALGFAALGLKTGILDADIYGPSQQKLFGLRGKPRQLGPRMLEPMERFGVKVMSIGFLVEEDSAMIWRGPIVAIEPDGVHAKHYIGMAREIWTTIVTGAAHRPPPRIVIE